MHSELKWFITTHKWHTHTPYQWQRKKKHFLIISMSMVWLNVRMYAWALVQRTMRNKIVILLVDQLDMMTSKQLYIIYVFAWNLVNHSQVAVKVSVYFYIIHIFISQYTHLNCITRESHVCNLFNDIAKTWQSFYFI